MRTIMCLKPVVTESIQAAGALLRKCASAFARSPAARLRLSIEVDVFTAAIAA